MRRAFGTTLDVILVFWVLAIGPFCWLLRNGLGPGSVDSHGADAVVRFLLTFYWGPVVAVLVGLRLLVRKPWART